MGDHESKGGKGGNTPGWMFREYYANKDELATLK